MTNKNTGEPERLPLSIDAIPGYTEVALKVESANIVDERYGSKNVVTSLHLLLVDGRSIHQNLAYDLKIKIPLKDLVKWALENNWAR